jgi:hypothetical protein
LTGSPGAGIYGIPIEEIDSMLTVVQSTLSACASGAADDVRAAATATIITTIITTTTLTRGGCG